MKHLPRLSAAPLALVGALVLSGCVENNASTSTAIAVTSSADDCEVESATATSGPVRFEVENTGDDVTEFYVLADDGLRIVGELQGRLTGIALPKFIVDTPGGRGKVPLVAEEIVASEDVVAEESVTETVVAGDETEA